MQSAVLPLPACGPAAYADSTTGFYQCPAAGYEQHWAVPTASPPRYAPVPSASVCAPGSVSPCHPRSLSPSAAGEPDQDGRSQGLTEDLVEEACSASTSGCESDPASCPPTPLATQRPQQQPKQAPWVDLCSAAGGVGLLDEAAALAAYLTLDEEEVSARDALRLCVQRALRVPCPMVTAKLHSTHSYGLGFASEPLGLVAEGCEDPHTALPLLCSAMEGEGMCVKDSRMLPGGAAEVSVVAAGGVTAVIRLVGHTSSVERSDARAVGTALRRYPQAAAAGVAARVLLGQCGVCEGPRTAVTHHQVMSAVLRVARENPAADAGDLLKIFLRDCASQGGAALGVPVAPATETILKAVSAHYIAQLQKGGLRKAVAYRKGMPFWGREC